jgi:hypothetical protein
MKQVILVLIANHLNLLLVLVLLLLYKIKNQTLTTGSVEEGMRKEPFYKGILIVDDDTDITLTFKLGLERYHNDDNDNSKIRYHIQP